MFLSDSHSDGTHSHPLLRHISPNLMKKQTHPDLGRDCNFWVNYSIKGNQKQCNAVDSLGDGA